MSETNGSPETFTVEPEPKLRFELNDEVIEDYLYCINDLVIETDQVEEVLGPDGKGTIKRWDVFGALLREVYDLTETPSRFQAKQIWQVVNTKLNECEDNLKKKLDDMPVLPIGIVPPGN